jgi:hypothetical protein
MVASESGLALRQEGLNKANERAPRMTRPAKEQRLLDGDGVEEMRARSRKDGLIERCEVIGDRADCDIAHCAYPTFDGSSLCSWLTVVPS